jgi:hypothetical protein
MFTARYGLSPYITQKHLDFKALIQNLIPRSKTFTNWPHHDVDELNIHSILHFIYNTFNPFTYYFSCGNFFPLFVPKVCKNRSFFHSFYRHSPSNFHVRVHSINPLTPEWIPSAQRYLSGFLLGILIFKVLTARRLYKSFSVKGLTLIKTEFPSNAYTIVPILLVSILPSFLKERNNAYVCVVCVCVRACVTNAQRLFIYSISNGYFKSLSIF